MSLIGNSDEMHIQLFILCTIREGINKVVETGIHFIQNQTIESLMNIASETVLV